VDGDRERDQERHLTLTEAAEVLGTSKDAVRMRARRGTLRSQKGEDGRVYVFLDPTTYSVHPEPEVEGSAGDPSRELVEVLRAQVEDLRGRLDRETEANRENRRIIAGLIERVPELEAPRSEPRGSDLRAEESPEGSTRGGAQGATEATGEGPERRPWWRRVFGG